MFHEAARARKGHPAPKRWTCRMCTGTGTVPVDPRDPRKGDKQCPNCEGQGVIG